LWFSLILFSGPFRSVRLGVVFPFPPAPPFPVLAPAEGLHVGPFVFVNWRGCENHPPEKKKNTHFSSGGIFLPVGIVWFINTPWSAREEMFTRPFFSGVFPPLPPSGLPFFGRAAEDPESFGAYSPPLFSFGPFLSSSNTRLVLLKLNVDKSPRSLWVFSFP